MGNELYAELYLRSLRPRTTYARQRSAIERLETLAADGRLTDYAVHVTGRAVPASRSATLTEFGQYLLNRVAVFEEWADRSNRPLGVPLEHRSVHSEFTDEQYEALVLPEMLLADYDEHALQFVAPSGEGEAHVSIEGRLDALAAGEEESEDAERLERARITRAGEFSSRPS